MNAILKFDFQKRKLHFSEVNYLNYTKKDPILHVATTFALKQGETRTSHGPIPHPLTFLRPTFMKSRTTNIQKLSYQRLNCTRYIQSAIVNFS